MTGVTGINDPGQQQEPQQEEQPARSLREIAQEMDRPEREPVYDDRYTERGDRRILPDDDGITRLPDGPRFRNEEQAYESRRQDEQDAEEQAAATELQQHDDFETNWRDTTRAAGTISTDDEKRRLTNYSQSVQQWQQSVARQQALERQVAPQIAELNRQGQSAAAHLLAKEVLAGREPIQKEGAELQGLAHQWQAYGAKKETTRGLAELTRLAPGLRDRLTREAFMSWLEREHAIPRSDAEKETNPQVVGRYFREYEKYEREQYRNLARKRVASEVPRPSRGAGSASSSADARKALAQGGKPADALAYFALRKAEKKYGL